MTSVGSILNGAFGLVRERPGAVFVWALAYIAAAVAMALAMQAMLETLPTGPSADPQDNFAMMQAMLGRMAPIWLLFIVLYIALYAAAQRAVLRPSDSAFAYLRLGMDELRLLGLSAILFVGLIVVVVALVVPIALITAILVMTAGPGAIMFVALLMYIAMIAAIVWLEVRLSLVFSLTILRRKIIIGESWRLTRGRFWTLFGAYFVLFLITLLLSFAASLVTGWPYFDEIMRGGFTPEAMQAAAERQMQQRLAGISAMTVVGWILSGVVGALFIALFGGAVATATRDLTGDAEGVAERFA